AAVLTLVSALRYRQRIEAAYRTLADDPARGPMYGPCSLEITDQGLRSVSPISESLHKWHGVSKVAARGGHVFVVLASGSALVISRESFAGPIRFEELVPALQKAISGYRPA